MYTRTAIPVGGATISINIPKAIVKELDIKSGDKLVFTKVDNGFLVTLAENMGLEKSIEDDSEQLNLL
ncbi:AbrB/MazE/SpoVT family DNA-binding domain-containing protein [Listeria seeligeri]|uniref:AbrB/MazE/SpoVT family DNA-binding domain-containing protein n=1 Tax=Listeria seeligeri TaxID=1640 RepID=UPI0010B2F217|nr:AbrB/MazE/SpoVT family DNA-binding domain-containing protein [Listeria seeligeri]EAC2922394.1 AbrB/MazE/SpoVT family DNA-binding domain-containing protein [Listeria monocytogenes]MBC1557002.1 AbrB/MazE/SpoVT family DNA-binding domain-containing protein [Listeria seeligeri]HAB0718278.1 hypothetical protein [Listeria monocytogenes]